MYYSGHALPQDYAEAARWYRLAAAQGNAKAQFEFGSMYFLGEGMPQDFAEAGRWFRRPPTRDTPRPVPPRSHVRRRSRPAAG